MAYIVMALYRYGLYSYGLYSYGLYSHWPVQVRAYIVMAHMAIAPCSDGLYGHGPPQGALRRRARKECRRRPSIALAISRDEQRAVGA